MSEIKFFVDYDKAEAKEKEWGIDIVPAIPVIKNAGEYGDSGIDLWTSYDFIVAPRSMKVVDTFIGFVFEAGCTGLVWPRSGDDFLVGAGVIDPGYRGTIKVKIINPYDKEMVFSIGDSVGQLVLVNRFYKSTPSIVVVDKMSIDKTDRGEDGRIVNQFNLQ